MDSALVVSADRIVTMRGSGEAREDAEAMAIIGDRVVAVGALDEMRSLLPHAPHRGFAGATIVPGFNDAHQHISAYAVQTTGLDLSQPELDRPEALASAIAAYASSLPPGAWAVGNRYDHTRSSGGVRITRSELDRIVPDRPVVLTHIGAHWAVANSRALELGGLDDSSPDPRGGELGRDADGRLDGYLSEQAMFDYVYPALASRELVVPPPSREQIVRGLLQGADAMLAAGITSVTDAMVGPFELSNLQEARRAGLPLRVNALITFPFLGDLESLGIRSGFGDEWLRIGGVKAFVDGAVAGRSCAVAEPFVGTDDRGIVTVEQQDVDELVEAGVRAGVRLAIHANGERAIEMVLDAVERAAEEDPERVRGLRNRIEHCSIVTPEIIRRIAALDMITVPFGSYAYYHGAKLSAWYGSERLERMFAHRSMLDAGIAVAGSSDYPCGPWEPLLGLQSCVTRRSMTGEPVGLSQRISLREAIGLYTVGSATASGEESRKGRLAPGYLADFAVLDGDLMGAPEGEIGATRVLSTWVGGVPRWGLGS